MSTTLAYVCPDCDRPCVPHGEVARGLVKCPLCGCRFPFAPWSYQEVLGAIALEALYNRCLHNFRAQRLIAPGREDWLKAPAWEALQPSMTVRALQAGVVFSTQDCIDAMQKQVQWDQARQALKLKRH